MDDPQERLLLAAYRAIEFHHVRQALVVIACAAAGICPAYRPDHNGECLNCDEPADMHPEAPK